MTDPSAAAPHESAPAPETEGEEAERADRAEHTAPHHPAGAGPGAAGDGGGPGHAGAKQAVRVALVIAALGIVFGDIGTSPLYALQTVFTIDDGAVRPTPEDVYGVVSLMF